MLLRKGLCLLLIVTFSFPAAAKPFPFSIQPTLDVNYAPVATTDEGGFWYKVEQLEHETRRSPYRVRDEQINAYLQDLVCKLAGEYCASIRVYLIDNPNFNASMYPNGMMHVWTGLLLRVENEAQLAAILGHEISHYLMAHQIERYRQARDSQTLAVFLDIGLAALTGVYGIATLGMAGGTMAFSRSQEQEADVLGAELMTRVGYQPNQAAKLWQGISEERQADLSKESRSFFWATHPSSESRAEDLKSHAHQLATTYTQARTIGQDALTDTVQPLYAQMMANHISLQEYEQTEVLLEKHARLGYPASEIAFFKGELHRMRGIEGDQEKAIQAYQQATQSHEGPVEAHKQLAYMYLKNNQNAEALTQFTVYLEKLPDASDKAMIEYYLNTLREK